MYTNPSHFIRNSTNHGTRLSAICWVDAYSNQQRAVRVRNLCIPGTSGRVIFFFRLFFPIAPNIGRLSIRKVLLVPLTAAQFSPARLIYPYPTLCLFSFSHLAHHILIAPHHIPVTAHHALSYLITYFLTEIRIQPQFSSCPFRSH